MEYRDYYRILGVERGATEKEIRAAYRKQARANHPDLHPGDKAAEKRFKEINEANEVLSDKEKRAKYDRLGSNWKQYETWQRAGGAGSPPPDLSDLFGGGSTSRGPTAQDIGDLFGGGRTGGGAGSTTFSDFFETFFGGARRAAGTARGVGARSGQDVEQIADISLEESFNGAVRLVQLTDDRGTSKKIEVKIPAGVTDGSRVRVAGGPAGDLFLVVRVAPSPTFTREGDDLRVRVPVSIAVAGLGGEIEVPTPRGSKLALKIPAETQGGQVFRLRGQGMPRLSSSGVRGDLFAEINLQLPAPLTERQRELLAEFSRPTPAQ